MARLVALDLPGGPAFVEALRRIWYAGDAAFVIDRRLPDPAAAALVEAMGAAAVVTTAGESTRAGQRPVEPGDALVVATSDSTGRPKGVVLTYDAVAASARATSTRLAVTPDDHWLACLPLSHVGGLGVVTRALVTGTALTVHDGFDAHRVAAAAAAGATLVSLVATVLPRIEAGAFRRIVLGGARPPASRPANAVTTYGMTETGGGVVYDGVPLDGVGVRVADDGEIWLSGPMLMRGYRHGDDPRVNGWLPTGDIGAVDPDGRLVVEGRRGDLIITGGENVWPEPVEALLRTVPGVADVAVVGRDDPEWGQAVTAVVVPTAGHLVTLDQLREAVKAELPAFAAPKNVEFADAIPRTALGKIRRSALSDRSADSPPR